MRRPAALSRQIGGEELRHRRNRHRSGRAEGGLGGVRSARFRPAPCLRHCAEPPDQVRWQARRRINPESESQLDCFALRARNDDQAASGRPQRAPSGLPTQTSCSSARPSRSGVTMAARRRSTSSAKTKPSRRAARSRMCRRSPARCSARRRATLSKSPAARWRF